MVMDGIIRAASTSNAAAAPAVDDDGMQCMNHPYRNAGGICGLCLQEKLGKLVSSSSSSLFNSASSSSPSPSFRSDPAAAAEALTLSLRPTNQTTTTRRPRIPFLKRSKSAVVPREYGNRNQKRPGFWSFLYHSKPKPEKTSSSSSSSARDIKPAPQPPHPPPRTEYVVVVDESVDSPNRNTTSFGRKVSRSRSVGCGNRSFSGDFFDRISTGLGDCTLRRVESQREGKRCSTGDVIHEKVRCAGIFGGFMLTSSSSSYWLSADVNGKEHSRSRSWGWALASPMRAFTKPSPSSSSSVTTDLKSSSATKSNVTPNLAAIPSLLTARG